MQQKKEGTRETDEVGKTRIAWIENRYMEEKEMRDRGGRI